MRRLTSAVEQRGAILADELVDRPMLMKTTASDQLGRQQSFGSKRMASEISARCERIQTMI